MKVTAILPDRLVGRVRKLAGGKNLTESLIIALREWADIRGLKDLTDKVARNPLTFAEGYSAEKVRELNRRK